MLPKQLQKKEFRFLLIKSKNKEPIESRWESDNNYCYDNKKLLSHINNGGNYGIIGGYGNLIIIDADSKEVTNICETLPETFTVQSSKEYKKHYYYITEKQIKPIRLSKEKIGDLGDVRSVGQYVVAPNSTHPKGMIYKVIKDLPIRYITETDIRNNFYDLIDKTKSTTLKNNYPIDTTLRNSRYIRKCRMPDYCITHNLKGDTSKNWELFPYLVDILHNRQSSKEVYLNILKTQGHSLGAIKGWVEKAQQGKLMKSSCRKMRNYILRYHPELEQDICGNCEIYKKMKVIEEKRKINELNYN